MFSRPAFFSADSRLDAATPTTSTYPSLRTASTCSGPTNPAPINPARTLRISIPAAPRNQPGHPIPAPGVVRRASDAAKSLSPDSLQVAEPFELGKKEALAAGDQLPIGELVPPLDMESASPEFVFGLDLNSDLPPHARTPF